MKTVFEVVGQPFENHYHGDRQHKWVEDLCMWMNEISTNVHMFSDNKPSRSSEENPLTHCCSLSNAD